MESPQQTYLIDGWPSSLDRMQTWNERVGECDALLWFTCEEEDRITRLKQRGINSWLRGTPHQPHQPLFPIWPSSPLYPQTTFLIFLVFRT